jgi:uncharacterized membrane protein HdeD (DUF308 family)
MKQENTKSLENLGRTAYRSGVLPIFLGVLIMFVAVMNSDAATFSVGLFVFVVGYAFVNIGRKIRKVLQAERT